MIDFLNYQILPGFPRLIHLILLAVAILAGRQTIREWLHPEEYGR